MSTRSSVLEISPGRLHNHGIEKEPSARIGSSAAIDASEKGVIFNSYFRKGEVPLNKEVD
jgi:hypothetical protein